MKPQLAYPLDTFTVRQGFGANPAYYAKFLDAAGNPQKGHPGLDLVASHGTPVYAAHNGHAIYIKDAHGGEGVWNYGLDGSFATINWHLIGDTDASYPLPIPFDGARHVVKKGDLIGYADNTGAPYESSGDHLHFGIVFLNQYGTILDQNNGFDGCVDPTSYFDGTHAHQDPQNGPQTHTEATIQDDLTQISAAVQATPTPQILAKAKQALTLVSQMIASLWS